MDSPAPTLRSHILGSSSVVRFFRGLLGSKESPKSCHKALSGGQGCPLPEQDTASLMTDGQGQGTAGRKEVRLPAVVPCTLSVARPQHDSLGLGLGDMAAQTPTSTEVWSVTAQAVDGKSLLPRGSQKVPDYLSEEEEKEEEEEEDTAEEASWDAGVSDRGHEAKPWKRAAEPLEVSPEAFPGEEEKERLLDGDLGLSSLKVAETPWNYLLTLYKQLQRSALAKLLLKEGLPHKEQSGEEEMEEEDSAFMLCVPDIVALQSPTHKTFRSTDTAGFMESELKKLLVVEQESHLWKMGVHEGQEPEIVLEGAGTEDGQGCRAQEPGSRPSAFGECWGLGGGVLEPSPKQHPRPEGRVHNPPAVASSTELLLQEMDELGNWPPQRETGASEPPPGCPGTRAWAGPSPPETSKELLGPGRLGINSIHVSAGWA